MVCPRRYPADANACDQVGRQASFFRPDGRIACSAGKIWPHIDTRGKGGYIIWWPAEGMEVLHRNVLAEIPEWIVKKLSPPEPTTAGTSRHRDIRAAQDRGDRRHDRHGSRGAAERHPALGRVSPLELVRQSILSHNDALSLAVEAAHRAGLSQAEASRTVKSAFRGQP